MNPSTWHDIVAEGERLGWFYEEGGYLHAGPRPAVVETEGPIRARLTSGEIVELLKDCDCIIHEGPHWLYMDWVDKQLNSELILRDDWLAPIAFAKEDGARLARKAYEFQARGIVEIIWPEPHADAQK
jgi:hypothetical protein